MVFRSKKKRISVQSYRVNSVRIWLAASDQPAETLGSSRVKASFCICQISRLFYTHVNQAFVVAFPQVFQKGIFAFKVLKKNEILHSDAIPSLQIALHDYTHSSESNCVMQN